MPENARIVVFTGEMTYSVRKGIAEIDRAIPGLQWLVLIHSPRKGAKQLLRNQWRNLRRNGWRWIPYQCDDILERLIPRRTIPATEGFPGYEYAAPALRARRNIRIEKVADIHSEESIALVRAFAPDLGLSLAAPILRRPIFSLPKHGTVNLHKGKVPDYRGMPPAFWEMWNDESSVGCTIHRVEDGLDTGGILLQSSVDRQKYSTVRGLQLCLDELGVRMTTEAAAAILGGRAEYAPQHGEGRTYRKPTLDQQRRLQKKLGGQAAARRLEPRNVARSTVSALARLHSRLGLRRYLEPRVTVLLYHRVTDEVRDNLTVGIEQFDRQMGLIRQCCEVLPLERILAMDRIPRSARPLVAVSFDDGYEDNFSHAAPILLRHGVPAAFFVSTGIVGSDNRFPHDARRGNASIPVMSWDQLRQMRDWGFTIGSHTVSHIDCVAESEQKVIAELSESSAKIRRELGIESQIFAYPYGGRRHMNARRLALVKEAGFIACLSAYGGTNRGSVDRFNVLRRGIHWEFSDSAFVFECMGLR